MNDGSGNFTNEQVSRLLFKQTAVNTSGTVATTTLTNYSVPAGVLSSASVIQVTAYVSQFYTAGSAGVNNFDFGYGNATTSCQIDTSTNTQALGGTMVFLIQNAGSNAQRVTMSVNLFGGTTLNTFTTSPAAWTCTKTVTGAVSTASAQPLIVDFKLTTNGVFNVDQVIGQLITQ
jgi:hypothetical protein